MTEGEVKQFYLMVAVDSDEECQCGIIDEEIYNDWNDGIIYTDSADHHSLFKSDHMRFKGTYSDCLEYVATYGGTIVDVLGAIVY